MSETVNKNVQLYDIEQTKKIFPKTIIDNVEGLSNEISRIDSTYQPKLPEGTIGQVLTKTEDGVEFKDIESSSSLYADIFSDDFETALKESIKYAKENNYN